MNTTSLARPALKNLRLLAEPSQLGTARRFAQTAAEAFGFDSQESYAFKFAASEAVANAIEHGQPCHDGTIRMWISEERSTLTLHVQDCGTFLPKAPTAGNDGSRGRGLMFMAAMVDEVELEPSPRSTVVRLTKKRATA